MGLSTYLANAILDHVFGKGAYTPPTHVHVALSTTTPTDTGTNVTPPSGNGYARVETDPADWNAADSRALTNLEDITFPQATGAWGTITHFCLYDAGTGGNFLGWGALTTPRAIVNLDTPSFSAGLLTAQLNAST